MGPVYFTSLFVLLLEASVSAEIEAVSSKSHISRQTRSSQDFKLYIKPSSGFSSSMMDMWGQNLFPEFDEKGIVQVISPKLEVLANCTSEKFGRGGVFLYGGERYWSLTCRLGENARKADVSGYLSFLTTKGHRYETTTSFTLKPDPVVLRISPLCSLIDTQIDLTISGQHLDSIYDPNVIISGRTPGGEANMSIITSCHKIDGSLLICRLSRFSSDWVEGSVSIRLQDYPYAIALFESFSLSIHKDIIFYSTLDPVDLDDLILTIRGPNMCLANEIEITVGLGNSPCRIIESDKRQIKCRIESDHLKVSESDSLFVHWKLGRMGKTIGKVMFTRKSTSFKLGWIILTIFICISGVVAYFIWVRQPDSTQGDRGKERHVSGSENCPSSNNDYSNDLASPQQSDVRNSAVRNFTAKLQRVSGQCSVVINGLPERFTFPDSFRRQKSTLDDEEKKLVLKLKKAKKLIARACLLQEDGGFGPEIGEGYFSRVYEGTFKKLGQQEHTVAIKVLKNERSDSKKQLLGEAVIMKDLSHPNILPLIGVTLTKDDMPALVLPFMGKDNLLSYVRGEQSQLTVRQLLTFTLEIARGMNYLSEMKIVHRDLAARNCMLDDDLNVKIADFGLSRDVCKDDHYSEKIERALPYRWMAIESLSESKFTSESDVWSYGVTSWEIMTRGLVPYSVHSYRGMMDHLSGGKRLQQPALCPDAVYQLWTRSWSLSPDERPRFFEIVTEINDLISTSDDLLKQIVPVPQPADKVQP